MDGPNPEASRIAREEGYLIRTRMNTIMEATDERDERNIESGSQITSFDQRYDYSWSLFKLSQQCQILDEFKYGKICHWTDL